MRAVRTTEGEGGATVCAVVVTHNRVELLRRCLDHLERQTRPPDAILVVDNASTDGTGDMLREQARADVLRLEENAGGAGGFSRGLSEAHARGYDWCWLMDDDTFAGERCLEALLDGARLAPSPPSIMSSVVRWKDGRLHPMNRPWPRTNARADFVRAAAAGLVPIRSASFVSTMVHRDAVDRHGLPHAHYFIWHDDTEYTRRVLAREHGYIVPDSVATHWTARAADVVGDERGRFYYKVRNHIWALRGDAFQGLEAMWGWKSLAVAIRSYVANSDSKVRALKTVSRGLRDGFLRPHK
jgi:GT2 family glycosyltransferase